MYFSWPVGLLEVWLWLGVFAFEGADARDGGGLLGCVSGWFVLRVGVRAAPVLLRVRFATAFGSFVTVCLVGGTYSSSSLLVLGCSLRGTSDAELFVRALSAGFGTAAGFSLGRATGRAGGAALVDMVG